MSLLAARGIIFPGEERRGLAERSRVVPIVRDIGWIGDATAPGAAPEYVHEPLNDQLVIVYAEDRSSSVRYLTAGDLEAMGIERAELRSLAAANLKKLLPPVSLQRGRTVAMVVAGGDYEASLLAAPELWRAIVPSEGELVVAIPARDLLLVTGTQTPDGIAQLREAAETLYQHASDRLTPELFVYREGTFSKLD